MDRELYILGKSNYALSIIFDMLKMKALESNIIVVRNIPEDENTSVDFKFENGIDFKEIDLDEFSPKENAQYIIGSIGKSRKRIKDFFEGQFGLETAQYLNLIHPSAVIADTVELGKGLHIGPMSVVAPFAKIMDHSTINRNVSVGHHTVLKELACLNPGVNVSGLCSIGINVIIGAGSTVLDQIVIGDGSVIGAGSVVTKNIESGVVVYGSPAKFVREI